MDLQSLLFHEIKEKLPSHLSLVDEISELLNISYDSAYRRIRGEKELSMRELSLISQKFDISMDALFNLKSDSVVFRHIYFHPPDVGVKQLLLGILHDLKRIKESKVNEIIYAAKDPPIFQYFAFPEIASFKMFFWEKTLYRFPQHDGKKFAIKDYNEEIKSIGEKVLTTSLKIPTIEIWNEDTFNITFKQIEHYWVSGLFENKDDIKILCDKLYTWIEHIKKQAELGFKFLYGTEPAGVEGSYHFYENEVVLNDNTVYVETDSFKATYITYNVLSLLITTDPGLCDGAKSYLKGILKESVLISSVNAKERHRFFNRLLEKIETFRNTLD